MEHEGAAKGTRQPNETATPATMGERTGALVGRMRGGDGQPLRMGDLLRDAAHPIPVTFGHGSHQLLVHGDGPLSRAVKFDVPLDGLDVPEPPLRAAIEHLVEGALLGNPSKEPYCQVSVDQASDEKLVLSVRDNGAPLPSAPPGQAPPEGAPDRIHRLFLAQNLVQWLGGHIRVDPAQDGAGNKVLVEIPRWLPTTRSGQHLVGRHVF